MRKLKKIHIIIKYTFIILVAVAGIGIVGGVPVQASNKNKKIIEVNVELMNDNQEDDNETLELEIKQ